MRFIFSVSIVISTSVIASTSAIATVACSTVAAAFTAAAVECIAAAIKKILVVVVIVMIETVVKMKKHEKHLLGIGFGHLVHDPFADNRLDVRQEFSFAFPSSSYEYQNKACSYILL